ncbi:MAG: fibronectin type III domain-containing protein [Candidatus Omnitrophota bacterium]
MRKWILVCATFFLTFSFIPAATGQVTVDNRPTSAAVFPIDVSAQSGGAVQAYPIAVPAGINGMEPRVALVYNSSQAQDILGVGWMLDMGSIEVNLKFGTPAYNSEDLFVLKLGGSQIELVYDNTSQFYRAKTEGAFIRVKKVSDKWEAIDRNGTKYFFGTTSATRLFDPAQTTRIFKWSLDRVEDVHGNFLTISYTKDTTDNNNQLYPQYIDYTGNTGFPAGSPLQPYARVEFITQSRGTAHISYASGFKIKTVKRISKIQVKAAGNLQREYRLGYTQSLGTNRDLLTSIQEFDANGLSALPAVTYNYYDNVKGFEVDTSAVIPSEVRFANQTDTQDLGVRIIDINADGFPDLIRDYVAVNSSNVFTHTKAAYINNKNNSWSLNSSYNLPGTCVDDSSQCATFVREINTSQGKKYVDFGLLIADLNNDGYNDLMYKQQFWFNQVINGNNIFQTNVNEFDYQNSDTGWSSSTDWTLPDDLSLMLWAHYKTSTNDVWWLQNLGNIAADVNNDGFTDFVLSNKLGPTNSQTTDITAAITSNKIVLVNLDGKVPGAMTRPDNNFTDFSKGAQLVDLNGDRLPDIFYRDASNIKVFMNTGTQWVEDASAPWVTTTQGLGNFNDRSTQLVDINGDGLDDMIIAKGSQAAGSRVLINTGNGWQLDNAWIFPEGSFVNLGTRVIDANADTMNDFIVHFNGVSPKLYKNTGAPADLLASVDNNYGGIRSYTYGSSSEFNQTFMPFSIPVITEVTNSNSLGDSFTTQQMYENGLWVPPGSPDIFDPSGQYGDAGDFRGFGKVSSDGHEEQYIVTEYFQDFYKKGLVKSQKTYEGDTNGLLLTESFNSYSVTPVSENDDINFVPLTEQFQCILNDTAARRCTRTQNLYDAQNLGNVTTVIRYGEVDPNKNDLLEDKVRVEVDYVNNTDPAVWILGLPKTIRVRDFAGVKVREAYLSYDGTAHGTTPAKGDLTEMKQWAGDNPGDVQPVTRYVYNGFGNMVSFIDPVNNAGASPQSTVVAYDSQYGIFPVTVTNPLGQPVSTAYYGIAGVPLNSGGHKGLWGQAKSVTDENNRTQSYVYDDHGRIDAVISPLDSLQYPSVSYDYLFENDFYRTGVFVRQEHNAPKTVDTYSYADGLNRPLYSKALSVTPNQYIISGQAKYDSQGKALQQYLPRFTFAALDQLELPDENNPHSVITYDALGRALEVINTDGTRANSEYNLWTVKNYNENGHRQDTEFDAFGRPSKITAYNGADGRFTPAYPGTAYTPAIVTEYLYDALGNLKEVKNGGISTLIAYNKLGQRVSINDPDMGFWTYSYDLNGNMLQQTDGNSESIHFTYDLLDRPVTKSDLAQLNISYEYDQGGAGADAVGRLTKILDNSQPVMEFAYDALGREAATTKKVQYNSYAVTPQYDALNNIKRIIYPNNQDVVYEYNLNGQVMRVANNDTPSSASAPSTAPAFTSTVPSAASVALQWTYVERATGYRIDYSYNGGQVSDYINTADVNAAVVSNLPQNTQISFTVRGLNAAGSGPVSGTTPVTTTSNQPPAAPVLNNPTPGNTQVSLSWNAVSGATGYRVRYGTSPSNLNQTKEAGTNTSVVVDSLNNNVQYHFAAHAYNTYGESQPSNPKSATPQPPVPGQPAIGSAVPGNGSVTVNWGVVSGADTYTVKYGTTSGGPYDTAIPLLTGTQHIVPNLTNGTPYYFVVSATNTGGQGPDSAQQSATPTAGGGGTMDISLLGTPTNYNTTAKASDSINHTVTATGSNRVLVVAVELRDTSTVPQTTTLTYGGQALTLAGRASNNTNTNHQLTSELWYLLNPPTGTNALAASFNTNVDEIGIQATSLQGVKQEAPEMFPPNSNKNNSPNLSVTTVTNKAWVIDAVTAQLTSLFHLTMGSGQTLLGSKDIGAAAGASSYKMVDPAGSATMQWSLAFSREWAMVAAAFAPAPLSGALEQEEETRYVYDVCPSASPTVKENSWSRFGRSVLQLGRSFIGLFTATDAYAQTLSPVDFNDFTENDPTSQIERSTDCVTFTNIETRSTNSYVYKAQTITGDFIYELDTVISAADTFAGPTLVWGVGNSEGTMDDWSNDKIHLAFNKNGSNLQFQLTTTNTISASFLTLGNRYYIRITKTGSTVTAAIYDVPSMEGTPVATLTRTNAAGSFSHVYGFSTRSYNTGTGNKMTGDVCRMKTDVGAPPTINPPVLNPAVPADGAVNLTWSTAANADSYKVYYGTASGTYGTPVSVTGTSYQVTPLNNGTLYYFAVKAVSNTIGESVFSNEVSKRPVGTPVLNSAVGGDGFVDLAWSPVSGATLYDYEYSWFNGTGTSTQTSSTPTNAATFRVQPLTNGTQYTFKVRAQIQGSSGQYSNSLQATPSSNPGIPSAPVISGSSATHNSVQLQWSPVPNAADYEVKYSQSAGGPFGNAQLTGGAASWTVNDLTPATTYYFTVRAFNSFDPTGMTSSPFQKATTAAPVPGQPVLNPVEFQGDGRIGLSWSAAANTDDYTVYYGTTAGSHPTPFEAGPDTFTTVTGLTNGTPYYFVVVANNQYTSGAQSNERSGTPAAPAAQDYVKNVKYNAAGQKTRVEFGNGVVTEYEYNPLNLRLTRVHTFKGTTELQDLEYTYDGTGNIIGIDDNLRPDSKSYTYDALGRLLAVNASVSPDKSYDYSADGNLELKDNNTQFYGENFDPDHALTSSSDGTDFEYDDNGNMKFMIKSGVTTEYVYDLENRLTKVTQNSVTLADYTYDDFGERVSKKVSGQRTDYFYPFFEKSAQKEDQYVIFDGVRIAKVSGGGAVTYFHHDHLGSHHVTTNSSGTQTLVTNYLPFGEFEGTPPTGTEGPNYTGQHYDSETGLYYYGARYYNPKVGRFLTADWIVQSPFNSQSYNRFSYVGNNPVNFVDPSGNTLIPSAEGYNRVRSDGVVVVETIISRNSGITITLPAVPIPTDLLTKMLDASLFDRYSVDNALLGSYSSSSGFAWQNQLDYVKRDAVAQQMDQAFAGTLIYTNRLVEQGAVKVESSFTVSQMASVIPASKIPEGIRSAYLIGKTVFEAYKVSQSNKSVEADANKLIHIFDNPKHNLGEFLKSYGNNQKLAFRALQTAIQKSINKKGITGRFEESVNIGKYSIEIRGQVVNNQARIGTAFIK